ncbi:sigma E protease regulator RseP [Salinimonas sp. HHU 13199]|uniref:Zinc metalloprotease n=1 Tax=Salinimonas profundi TaxID=2729140 RepID=A0ABR8LJA5_9ALTE|nr:sigma E protease regulator RseP [Salinimonas profundi]MBD3585390.1 sigma E protease regulator RseP [Salinimonas profundi]
MFSFFWSLGAFIVALGILVAVHEWGHFFVARRCGVKVERFSIGFGKPLWRRVDKHGTEFVVAAIPLGGYVRMLDERIDTVAPGQKDKAFNNKPVLQRIAIIAAGPGVNFIFALFALFVMYLIGLQTVKPVIGQIEPDSIAAQANLPEQAEIVTVGSRTTPDWESVNFELVSYIGKQQVPISLKTSSHGTINTTLNTTDWNFDPEKESALGSLGITPFRPDATLTLAVVAPDSPAAQAGLQVGDTLTMFNGDPIDDWAALVEAISDKPGENIVLTVNRDGQARTINATIARRDTEQGQSGYLGVSPQFTDWPEGYVFVHQYGPVEALVKAGDKTWRLITLSLSMIGKLLTGDVSLNNLSGPISIAQGAGVSAGYGLVYFLSFLALISVNLGIINLLPLPMLDGGHLMYFAIEWVTGKPVSEVAQEWGFRIGGVILFMIMGIAIFNDISRIA